MNYGKKGASDKQKSLTSRTAMVGKKVSVTFFKAFVLCLIVITVTLACAGIGVAKGIIDSAPDISKVDVSPSGFSTTVYDQDGNELTKLVASGSNRIYVSIDEIPKSLQHAVIAIEDERFYEHNGIDLIGIARAGVVGIKSGHFSEGASTITQQLLKNNVFEGWVEEKTFAEKAKRKIQEQYSAIQLEKQMSKELILENYLNTINLGQNTLGVQAASMRYFNKDVSELNISESATIAAITQNPTRFNPISNPESNKERRLKVLNNMLKQEYITQEEFDTAVADDVYSRIQIVNAESEDSSIYTYFVDELTEQVINDLKEVLGYTQTQAFNALYSGGLSIYTTQDMAIQRICDEEFSDPENYPKGTEVSLAYRLSVTKADGSTEHYNENMMETYFSESNSGYDLLFSSEEEAREQTELYKESILGPGDEVIGESITLTPQPQASVTVMDQSTGYVKAIVGGRGTKEASLTLNRATNTVRQPGSTFKLLAAYAPALDIGGMTLATVQDDAPYNYSSGRPISNWYSGYRGLSSIRLGIQDSMNIVAVKTLTDISPQLGFDYVRNFGITTLVEKRTTASGTVESDINQSLALGGLTDGVTNLELTAAYAAIANHGTYIKPVFYTKILDHDGNVLIDNTPQSSAVIKETTAFLLTSAMQDVVTKGTGTALKLGSMPVAGKTGTTSKNYDLWFAGYTPYYTASVWAGYDTNYSMKSASYHKVLWKKIMERIHEGLDTKEFSVPEGIVTASICKKSGKLAVPGLCDHDPRGSMISQEYFAKGTVPTEVCDVHVKATMCIVSGKLASDYCPPEVRTEQIYIVRPEGNTGGTADSPYEMPTELSGSICDMHGPGDSIVQDHTVIDSPPPEPPVTPDTDNDIETPEENNGGNNGNGNTPENNNSTNPPGNNGSNTSGSNTPPNSNSGNGNGFPDNH